MSRKTRQINVSVVTREPSFSRTVRNLVRASLRFERHLPVHVRKLRQLPDDELRQITVVAPSLQTALDQFLAPAKVLTPTIGLYELLPRVAGIEGIPADCITLEPEESQPHCSTSGFEFFGYPTTIQLPLQVDSDYPAAVLALISRPGGDMLQLTGQIVESEISLRSALEVIVRDHIEQWTPATALWPDPIEELDSVWLVNANKRQF